MNIERHSLRVALTWNGTIFAEKTYGRLSDPTVTVGEAHTNAFVVPAAGLPEIFQMFERRDDGYVVRFTDKLDGHVTSKREDESFDLEELIDEGKATKGETASTDSGTATIFSVDLAVGDHGILDLGDVSIFFQILSETPIVPLRGPFGGFEAPLMGFCAISAVLHLGLLLYAELSYDPDAVLNPILVENRFVDMMAQGIEDPPEEVEVEEPVEDTTGKKAGGEEGKFGAEDSEVSESKIPKVDGEMVKEIDVKNIGVNKALSSDLLGSGPLKSIFGDQAGFDDKMSVAMSGEGGDFVLGRGPGGMGLRGGNRGGGGDGDGRIGGLGKFDTGGGVSAGGKIGKKKKTKRKPSDFEKGTPSVGDFCDKANIRRVVNAKSNAIRYCFEKELQANPKLSGKIVAQWKVNMDGSVLSTSTASTTMGNKKVEGCIERVIKRMRFQKPDGGICIINYPFVFSGVE